MDEHSGFELSLLEGMDEALLTRLHREGVRTRQELESRIAVPADRAALARKLGVPARRLEAIHHLNFLLPEERAARFLALERRVSEQQRELKTTLRRWPRIFGTVAAGLLLVSAVLYLLRTGAPGPDPVNPETAARLDQLERRVDALAPLGAEHLRRTVLGGIQDLGPAPGWRGAIHWSEADAQRARLLVDEDTAGPVLAVAFALGSLAALENAPDQRPRERAEAAARFLQDFPPVGGTRDIWDASATLLRTRFQTRTLGLGVDGSGSPELLAAVGWSWTSPGFLTSETLLARLESMRLREEALETWSASLIQIRHAADLARSENPNRPEALARDYWIRRAELELAVVVAVLGRETLLPYHASSPSEFLAQRDGFLERVVDTAPPGAAEPLAWLAVEYAEARSLLAWLDTSRGSLPDVADSCWVTALDAIEGQRGGASGAEEGQLETRLARAVRLGGTAAPDPWTAPRTAWEAGLRPLLMVTRARGSRPASPAEP